MSIKSKAWNQLNASQLIIDQGDRVSLNDRYCVNILSGYSNCIHGFKLVIIWYKIPMKMFSKQIHKGLNSFLAAAEWCEK